MKYTFIYTYIIIIFSNIFRNIYRINIGKLYIELLFVINIVIKME